MPEPSSPTRAAADPKLIDLSITESLRLSRRLFLNSSLALAASSALAACDRGTSVPTLRKQFGPLKSLAPFPVGVCVHTTHLDDPEWVDLALRNVSQVTPEAEMKMQYILSSGFDQYRFDAPDRIADFAKRHGLRLHGHTLIWYAKGEASFADLRPARFGAEFDRYIATVAGRYRGKVVSWDVVNEPVAEDGNGLRDSHWSRALGDDDYMIRAFHQAKAADPEAILFINDYDLENIPAKGATFLRLVERLLKAGAPIGGIGSQSHLDIEIPAGQATSFIRDAASLGLPIHISELDASLRNNGRIDFRSHAARIEQQTARVRELAQAFMALPTRQRFAFSAWGLRDTDSWLRQRERDDGQDQPLLFDAAGQPNPMFDAVAEAFRV